MKATIKQIYDYLLDGRTVKVPLSDRRQADNLRIALVKRNREFVAVDISDKSLRMVWDAGSKQAAYSLVEPKEKTVLSFEVISDESGRSSEEISTTLDDDTNWRGASDYSLPESNAATNHPTSDQEKVRTE